MNGELESDVGSSASSNQINLTQIQLPAGLKVIGSNAFEKSGLTSVQLPSSITSIESWAFYSCTLSDVYYGGSIDQWTLISIGSYNEPITSATIHYAAIVIPDPDFILPVALTTIEDEAFAEGAFIFIELLDRACSIGWYAFADCPNLAYIYIPTLTTQIDDQAFGSIQSLTILGKAGSVAEGYAQNHNFSFTAVPKANITNGQD